MEVVRYTNYVNRSRIYSSAATLCLHQVKNLDYSFCYTRTQGNLFLFAFIACLAPVCPSPKPQSLYCSRSVIYTYPFKGQRIPWGVTPCGRRAWVSHCRLGKPGQLMALYEGVSSVDNLSKWEGEWVQAYRPQAVTWWHDNGSLCLFVNRAAGGLEWRWCYPCHVRDDCE